MAVLGPSCGHLGAILGHLGASLGDLGAILGHLGAILGDLGAVLGRLGRHDEYDRSLMMQDRGLRAKMAHFLQRVLAKRSFLRSKRGEMCSGLGGLGPREENF